MKFKCSLCGVTSIDTPFKDEEDNIKFLSDHGWSYCTKKTVFCPICSNKRLRDFTLDKRS